MRPSTLVGVLAGLLVAAVALIAVVVILPDIAPETAAGSPPASAAASAPSTIAPPSAPIASVTPPPLIGDGPPPGSIQPGPGASGTPAVGSSSVPGPSYSPSLSPSPTPSPTPIPGVGLTLGQRAPELVVERLGGSDQIDLVDLRGTPVWIVFMASWCPSCQDELPLLESYHRQLGARLGIVLVDVREEPATVAAFAKALKLDVQIGIDKGGAAQRAWSAYALPIHYWLDGDGIVRGVAYGGLGPEQMRPNIQSVVPGASLTP
jgi:thiol-disulfide isomerase/thioredoxin